MTDLLFIWAPLIGALIAVLFGGWFLLVGFRGYVGAEFLRRDGVPGTATVTQHYQKEIYVRREDRHKQSTRFENAIDYEIQVDGQKYEHKGAQPTQALWDSLSVGAPVEILYLPRDPGNSRLAEHSAVAGLAGGGIQMAVGAVLVAGGVGFVVSGLIGAAFGPDRLVAGADWVPDQGRVLRIEQSNDPFVRIMRPQTRVAGFQIGDDDGGREYVGYIEIPLDTGELPRLKVGDVLPVLRVDYDKDRAVLTDLQ